MREERMICGTKRNRSTCKRMRKILFPAVLLAGLLVCGCSDGAQNSVTGVETDNRVTGVETENTVNGTGTEASFDGTDTGDETIGTEGRESDLASDQDTMSERQSVDQSTGADEKTSDQGTKPEEDTPKTSLFLGKYDSFEAWMERRQGSVGFITDRTLLLSVYLEEPDYQWTEEDIQVTNRVKKIAYSFLEEELREKYDTQIHLIYDVEEHEDLLFHIKLEENIPAYVTTEKEREIDDLEDAWIATLPVRELMEKYQADSVGFLFFLAHEGCSYSSMHFIDDGVKTWDESCLLYLRDMYSKTLEYETPAVYAHELLHLYGAEDLYTEADVFSKDTYEKAQKQFSGDLMINTYDVINGKYTIYSDSVKQIITPLTAYLIGVPGVEYPLEGTTELVKEEVGCFSGSTYDRPF